MAVSRIVLLGLDDGLAVSLESALPPDRFRVLHLPASRASEALSLRADVICLPADPSRNRGFVRMLQDAASNTPYVMVTQQASPQEWLSAVQSGAVDYIEPPFESGQLEWKFVAAKRSSPMKAFVTVRGAVAM